MLNLVIVLHGTLLEILRHPRHRVFGVANCSTYLSYLVLARGAKVYWPRYDEPMPQFERVVLEAVMPQFSGQRWKAERGIVEATRISFQEGKPTPPDLDVPEIAFYARANPGQEKGEALVCIAPLDLTNLASVVLAGAKKQLRRLHRG